MSRDHMHDFIKPSILSLDDLPNLGSGPGPASSWLRTPWKCGPVLHNHINLAIFSPNDLVATGPHHLGPRLRLGFQRWGPSHDLLGTDRRRDLSRCSLGLRLGLRLRLRRWGRSLVAGTVTNEVGIAFAEEFAKALFAKADRFSKRIAFQDLHDTIQDFLIAEASSQRGTTCDTERPTQRAAASRTASDRARREGLRQAVLPDAVKCRFAFICGRNPLTVTTDG